ncbi:MAG: phosphate ABC transporter permease PstA [Pseudomonadota bacterium]
MKKTWWNSGQPWIWLNAGALSLALIAVAGLLILIAVRGLSHFWPAQVLEVQYHHNQQNLTLIGEIVDEEHIFASQSGELISRYLFKIGNRELDGYDFKWLDQDDIIDQAAIPELMVLERMEWGNFYGNMVNIKENNTVIAESDWSILQERLERVEQLRQQIRKIEKHDIGSINYQLERLRLKERKLALAGKSDAQIEEQRKILQTEFQQFQLQLKDLRQAIQRDSLSARVMDGQIVNIPLVTIVKAYQPNAMNIGEKLVLYFQNMWAFMSGEPREANTEGGIFPAIFGTVLMVMLMSLFVTPFGIVAALYLREYARQGLLVRLIRIAVNNLAGVPSIVYGVFGLGFFVYFLGGNLDALFFPEALPAPTFGTPGILWSSLVLALLTLPVVIVATEEGLARIPRSLREGSLALGATKAETLWRIVLPMASPALMTGMILAVARAAGEVAPLMLVGVVKLAPSLPLDGNFPFLHLDRKFMHLGFHIYDVGFQSPNVEAARPLVYATALLLVLVIVLLNLTAITWRNRLREKYKALES